MTEGHVNKYAQFLKEQGIKVITTQGIHWYNYGRFIMPYRGFMMPAYLPHCCPEISGEIAQEVVRISGLPFARWDTNFGQIEESQWWYVLKRGPWTIDSVKDKKKRWMIRQGKKKFTVRPLTFEEVMEQCPKVAQLAAARYKGEVKVETQEEFDRAVSAAKQVPGILEYIGCFNEKTLVGFSENHIQDNAVWLVNIRYDPAFLNKYSSYGLIDGILNYYLNEKKMSYVQDGCRSIHHRTDFQKHLTRVFGFTKEFATLNILYSRGFGLSVKLAYPFRSLVWALRSNVQSDTLDKVGAILKQEHIRRACEYL